jgi:hypothetical protein
MHGRISNRGLVPSYEWLLGKPKHLHAGSTMTEMTNVLKYSLLTNGRHFFRCNCEACKGRPRMTGTSGWERGPVVRCPSIAITGAEA